MTKKKPPPMMTGDEYKAALDTLGLHPVEAARFLRCGERTSRRYAEGKTMPYGIAMLLRLMIERQITPQELGFEK